MHKQESYKEINAISKLRKTVFKKEFRYHFQCDFFHLQYIILSSSYHDSVNILRFFFNYIITMIDCILFQASWICYSQCIFSPAAFQKFTYLIWCMVPIYSGVFFKQFFFTLIDTDKRFFKWFCRITRTIFPTDQHFL